MQQFLNVIPACRSGGIIHGSLFLQLTQVQDFLRQFIVVFAAFHPVNM